MWRLAALVVAFATPAVAENVVDARYDGPTTRYAHGVLGDAVEWGELVLETDTGRSVRFVLPEERVFEDVAPRLFDVDLDGDNEVIVVEAHREVGARLAIYDVEGLVAANSYIGRPNRWLAPIGVGAADFDSDGFVELVYVDRPHLAKTVRVLRLIDGELRFVASFPGVTNHRIGERDIAGGIRDCGYGPEMIVASVNWERVLALGFKGLKFSLEEVSPHEGRESFARAMACE
ncbi:MAG: VCBS repeat-containing protein [Boseongicola sp.]|nr:VCBS repeat-containing protein [Boseongicola sp.]